MLECGDLHEIEVIQQAYPHDTRHEMDPAGQRRNQIDVFHCLPPKPGNFWQKRTGRQ
jgi:hypothetical protein